MVEKLQYELTLSNRATGTGAKDTAAGLDAVGASASRAATKGRTTDDFLAATTSKAKTASFAYYDLDKALTKTANSSEGLVAPLVKVKEAIKTTSSEYEEFVKNIWRSGGIWDGDLPKSITKTVNTAEAAGRSMQGLRGQFQNVGYQVGDFAVQMQGGGSAMVAFTQQGTQLLGALGPYGAIAGALLAVGGAVYKSMSDAKESTSELNAKVEESIQKLNELAAKAGEDIFQKYLDNLASLGEQQKLVNGETIRQIELDGKLAESKQAIASAQQDLMGAAIEYLSIIDHTFDKESALQALQKQGLQTERDAQIAEQQNRLAVEKAKYDKILADKKIIEDEAEGIKKEIEELQAKAAAINNELNFSNKQDRDLIAGGYKDKGYKSRKTLGLEADLKNVDAPMDKAFEALDQLPGMLAEMKQKALEQGTAIDQVLAETDAKINEINTTYNLKNKADDIRAATEQTRQGAEEIQKAVEAFVPFVTKQQGVYQTLRDGLDSTGQTQQAAKDAILKALSDGKITAEESQAIGTNLNILLSTLREGQTGQADTLKELIDLSRSIHTTQTIAESSARALKSDVLDLQKRMREQETQPR